MKIKFLLGNKNLCYDFNSSKKFLNRFIQWAFSSWCPKGLGLDLEADYSDAGIGVLGSGGARIGAADRLQNNSPSTQPATV